MGIDMLTKQSFIKMAVDFTELSSINRVSEEMALTPDCVGMRIFDAPLVGFASADDPIFEKYKDPQIQSERCLSVDEWLPGAKTVIAVFLPASEVPRETNKADMSWPSPQWIHTRWEGEKFQDALRHYLCDALRARGYRTCMPSHDDPRYSVIDLVSNWSERHVAYACGLGTFNLAANLLTERGCAGRIISIITDWEAEPTTRTYEGIYDYCIQCGECIGHCPVQAIQFGRIKNHKACRAFQKKVGDTDRDRYGCGKCQVAVPCECGIPGRR